MVAYFRFQNNLLMALGAVLGLGAAVLCRSFLPQDLPGYILAFLAALAAFAGVVAGRIVSFFAAGRRRKALLDILYTEGDAKRFLEKFSPVVKGIPSGTVEYVDGVHHLAYAYEAMGEYDKSLELLNSLKPESLRLHSLVGQSLVTNQKLRLCLLKGETEAAKALLEELEALKETARMRAPAVCSSLEECLRLFGIWFALLSKERPVTGGDISYVEEEIRLTENPIHRREMNGLLEQLKMAEE